jgi:LDH2 family malate/lactate/ureidoglycolate dehydrogenase
MGMLNCSLAMDVAIEKARAATIAWVGVRNSSHFGAAGYYASLAGHRDMIGIAMSNADPNMVIPGARGHVIGNNPLAYAVPSSKKPLLLDIALSTAAFGKILNMKISGKSIPSTWITDADGLATSDLQDWPAKGSLQPMAGHKGYGLALFVEILAGALTGAGVLGEVKSWVFQPKENSKLGQAFIAIDIGQIIPISVFKQRIDLLVHEIKNSPRAKGELCISVPGEVEWEKREDALKNGIPFPETILSTLATVAQDLGIDTSFL